MRSGERSGLLTGCNEWHLTNPSLPHPPNPRLHPNPVYDPALPDCGYGGSQILHIEGHSRERQDFYPVTIGLDFLAFLYAAIFFRATFPTVADFANTGEMG